MRTLAYVSVIVAIVVFILGLLSKLGMSVVTLVGPAGFMKATMVFLLFGINFELLGRKHQ